MTAEMIQNTPTNDLYEYFVLFPAPLVNAISLLILYSLTRRCCLDPTHFTNLCWQDDCPIDDVTMTTVCIKFLSINFKYRSAYQHFWGISFHSIICAASIMPIWITCANMKPFMYQKIYLLEVCHQANENHGKSYWV